MWLNSSFVLKNEDNIGTLLLNSLNEELFCIHRNSVESWQNETGVCTLQCKNGMVLSCNGLSNFETIYLFVS